MAALVDGKANGLLPGGGWRILMLKQELGAEAWVRKEFDAARSEMMVRGKPTRGSHKVTGN